MHGNAILSKFTISEAAVVPHRQVERAARGNDWVQGPISEQRKGKRRECCTALPHCQRHMLTQQGQASEGCSPPPPAPTSARG